MKPSQQIAEEMAAKFAQEQRICYDSSPPSRQTQILQDISTKNQLLEELPLAQLIEVARAASRVDLTDCECTCYSNPEGSCRYCGYFIRLGKAIDALKQTGKEEWLNNL